MIKMKKHKCQRVKAGAMECNEVCTGCLQNEVKKYPYQVISALRKMGFKIEEK